MIGQSSVHNLFTALIPALVLLCAVEVQYSEMHTLSAVRTGEHGICKHRPQNQSHDAFIHKLVHFSG